MLGGIAKRTGLKPEDLQDNAAGYQALEAVDLICRSPCLRTVRASTVHKLH